jgi:DNA-directed RNA polymerase sigma subunit (sigma70/sigma32)
MTELDKLAKETELPDNWRYKTVGKDTYLLEGDLTNEEDKLISMLDGLHEAEEVRPGIDYLQDLDEVHRKVVFYYLWEGLSFEKIGRIFGWTKQRSHQIYHEGISQLKVLNGTI